MQNKIAWWFFGVSIVIATVLRIVVPWNVVFRAGQVVFTEVDPYYFMNIADKIIKHPQIGADPFSQIISILSFGNIEWVDTVGAFLPAVCGVLLVVPVFFMAKKLFGMWAGVAGALFVATIQGDVLARTSLGFTDHHCLEILLPVSVMCCIVYAVKKNFHFTWLAGLLLGLYACTWKGAPIFELMLCVYIIVQSIINHFKRDGDDKIYWIMFGTNFVALCMFFLWGVYLPWSAYIFTLVISTALPVVLYGLVKLTTGLKVRIYLICLVEIGMAIGAAIYSIAPDIFRIITEGMQVILISGEGYKLSSATEEQYMSFQMLWNNLGMISVFGLIGLMLLFVKEDIKDSGIVLLIIWGITVIFLSVMMRRFMVYLAPVMCITCAYIVVKLVMMQIKDKKEEFKVVMISCAVVFCCAFMVVPNSIASVKQNSSIGFAPSTAWIKACDWLKHDDSGYIREYSKVLSWWDYGYWIIRMGQKDVVCNPGGGRRNEVALCLMSIDEDSAMVVIKKFKVRYIVMDYTMVGLKWSVIEAQAGLIANVNDCFAGQLWDSDKLGQWVKVWESGEKYNKDAQVKIFELQE